MSNPSPSLETYLAQIAGELRALPPQARADEMREIEAHLSALVQASQQLEDTSHVQATATALRQFGAPRKVGRNLRKAWERKQPEAWWRAASAPVFALAFSTYFSEPFEQGFHNFDPTTNMVSIISASFLLTFTTSYIMGLISPKRTKVIIGVFLPLLLAPNIWNGVSFSSPWTLASSVSFAIAAIIGSHFGARHSRKFSALFAT